MSIEGAVKRRSLNDRMSSGHDLRVLTVVVATPEARGGAVRAGLQLGDHLTEHVAVDTAKMRGEYDGELLEELRLTEPVYRLPSKTLLRDLGRKIVDSPNNYSNALIWTRVASPRPLADYDLLHLHNAVPLAGMVSVALAARRAGVPYCVTTHGISKIPNLPVSMNLSGLQRRVFDTGFMKPYLSVLRNARHLFALSENDARSLRDRFPAHSISVVPNGVEENPPTPESTQTVERATGIPDSRPLLLFVGKLMQNKGVDDLLAAYERIEHDCSLVIVGPPQDHRYVERIERYDSINVQYLGYTDQSTLDHLYQRAGVFVFPTRSDVFPLVMLEAMAAETPVVSTTVGGIPEQISEDTGVLVPPGDPGRLAEAVDDLLADETRRTAMGKAAYRRTKERFSWDSVAEQTAEDYRDVLR